jgi:hypothetical protein
MKEACLYGIGLNVGRLVSQEEKKLEPDAARTKSRMSAAVQGACLHIVEEAPRTACMQGIMRFVKRLFTGPETQHVMCAAMREDVSASDCLINTTEAYHVNYMEHFAIQH